MKSANQILTSAGKFRICLGLDRTKKVLSLLGNPQNKCKFIHIAGTNGKGSTSKIINDILIEHFKSKAKIGLYTSPHLFSYCERIKINNEDIDEQTFNRIINEIDNIAQKNDIDLTEFELLTAGAFKYFADNNVEYVVLETGLGGLYDSTNVIDNPLVSVITTIDYEHTERLGKTIEEIALQKAGIIKENSKVIVLEDNLGYETIKKVAQNKNALLIKPSKVEIEFQSFENNFALIKNEKYKFNLLGAHQKDNLSLALGAIEALDIKIKKETIKTALEKVQWRFRLEYIKNKNLLIDSAHNPNGIKALKEFIDKNIKEEKIIIFGCLKNKDYNKMLEILLENEHSFCFLEFNYPNALKFDEIPEKFKIKARPIKDIKEVKDLINNNKTLKIICGSIYMLGQVFNGY